MSGAARMIRTLPEEWHAEADVVARGSAIGGRAAGNPVARMETGYLAGLRVSGRPSELPRCDAERLGV